MRRRASPVRSTPRRTFKIQPVSSAEVEEQGSWVIYGESGSGKTTLSSSFPGKRLVLDINDHGLSSISDVKGTDYIRIQSFDQLREVYWMLRDEKHPYKTVVLDTLTQAQSMLVTEIAGDRAAKLGKSPDDWGVMKKQEWGEVAAALKTLTSDLRSLPMEVVFLAQTRTMDGEEDFEGEVYPQAGPRLMPSVRAHVCAEAGVIAQTFVREREIKSKKNPDRARRVVEYCVRLGPSQSFITKVRKPKDVQVPEVLADPSYEDILSIIKGDE